MRVALHACCGPCLLEPFDAIAAEHERVTVVYANPNIHPVAEYERRRDTLLDYAESEGIVVIELPYDPAQWVAAVAPYVDDRTARCRACYRLRIGQVARWAAENGYDAVTTTLTVSPYQDSQGIAEEGKIAAEKAGVVFLERDFRDRYPEATRRSRGLGMYRQNYCGCMLSDIEARQEREQRKRRV